MTQFVKHLPLLELPFLGCVLLRSYCTSGCFGNGGAGIVANATITHAELVAKDFEHSL